MRWMCILLLSVVGTVQAQESRHALVIGNSKYIDVGLVNPYHDATDMANMLRSLGFTLHRNTALYDLDQERYAAELAAFTDSLPRKAVVVVYFAGHGASWNGDNYLIPIGAKISAPEQLFTEAISLNETIASISNQNSRGINIYFLDACRNNPPVDRVTGNVGFIRLAENKVPHNSFIGYAAEEGAVASDGSGNNGRYTAELLSALRNHADKPIAAMHQVVRERVFSRSQSSGERQTPVEHSKVTQEFCFKSCANAYGMLTEEKPEKKSKRSILYAIVSAVAVALLVNASDKEKNNDSVILNLTPPAQ